MSSSMWRQLSEEHGGTLYKKASGQHTIEVIDEFLVPMVRVTGKGKTSEFKLEAIDAEFSDEDQKFFDLNTGEEVVQGELNDRAIEKHLTQAACEMKEGEEKEDEEKEEKSKDDPKEMRLGREGAKKQGEDKV